MRKGFTLIELLLVVVIIGIVASFVLPRFGDVKERAYVSNMKSDLRNSATNQEIHFADNSGYIAAENLAAEATQSADVTLGYVLAEPTRDGYVLGATHAKSSTACVLNRGLTAVAADAFLTDVAVGPGQVACGPLADGMSLIVTSTP